MMDFCGKILTEYCRIAPFLEQPAGKTFSDSLWAETVEDVAKYDPGLKTYA